MYRTVVAFFLVSLAELIVIVFVANQLGALPTFLLMLACSVAGAVVLRVQGTNAARRVVAEVNAGRRPTNDLVDGSLVVCSGLLLLLPGFITAAIGVVLAIPPLRAIVRKYVLGAIDRRVARFKESATTRSRGSVSFGGNTVFTTSSFGFGSPNDHHRGRDGDIIDLEGEEIFPDEPMYEIENKDVDGR